MKRIGKKERLDNVPVRIPPELHEGLKELAYQNRTSMNLIVRGLVFDAVTQNPESLAVMYRVKKENGKQEEVGGGGEAVQQSS